VPTSCGSRPEWTVSPQPNTAPRRPQLPAAVVLSSLRGRHVPSTSKTRVPLALAYPGITPGPNNTGGFAAVDASGNAATTATKGLQIAYEFANGDR